MKRVRRYLLAVVVLGWSTCGLAQATADCLGRELLDHVLMQFELYGPRSTRYEYFGFIYRSEGIISSAVVRGARCNASGNCTINTQRAANLIPRGARVLGEWHTHARNGSTFLSSLDVTGAYANRNIRCYAAFYSQPNGEIHSWDPGASSVPIAMHTVARIGAFDWQAGARLVRGEPGPR